MAPIYDDRDAERARLALAFGIYTRGTRVAPALGPM